MDVSKCQMCHSTAKPSVSLLNPSHHYVYGVMDNMEIKMDYSLPAIVCTTCLSKSQEWFATVAQFESTYKILRAAKDEVNKRNELEHSKKNLHSLSTNSHENKNEPSTSTQAIYRPIDNKEILNKNIKSVLDSDQIDLYKKYKLKELNICVEKLSTDILNSYNIKPSESCALSKENIDNINVKDELHTQSAVDSTSAGVKDISDKTKLIELRTTLINKLLEKKSANHKNESDTTDIVESELSEPSTSTQETNESPEYLPEPKIETDFNCYICKKLFSNSFKKHLHIAIVHTNKFQNEFQCTVCDLVLNTKNILLAHIKKYHKGTVYHCKICSYTTQVKLNLRIHNLCC